MLNLRLLFWVSAVSAAGIAPQVAEAQADAPPPPVAFSMAGVVEATEPFGAGLRAAVLPDGDGTVSIETVDGAGRRTGLVPVGPSAGVDETAALTNSGAIAAGTSESARGKTTVEAVTLENGVSRSQRLSSARYGALLTSPIAVGPTGAAGLVMVQVTRTGGVLPTLAFRPAGARSFRRPVAIAGPGAAGDTGLVVLGPDGGGVVLSLPDRDIRKRGTVLEPTLLRRISPGGRLGPPQRLRLGTRGGGHTSVTAQGRFLHDGTFVAVFSATDATHVSAWFTSLAHGAVRPSRPQHLADSDEHGGFARLAIDEDPARAGHLTAIVDDRRHRIRTYTGTARRLHRAALLPRDADWSGLARLADGRLVAYGLGDAGILTTPVTGAPAVATPLPGYTPPPSEGGEVATGTAVALPDGRLAVPSTNFDGQAGAMLLAAPPG